MTSPTLMHEAGHSKPVHWDNPEDNPRRREVGGGFRTGHPYMTTGKTIALPVPSLHGK